MAKVSRHHGHPIRTLITFGLVIAVLYTIMAISHSWTPKLGLDLSGGTTITLTAASENGGAIDPESLEVARNILQQRIDGLGVGESEVTTSGDKQIIVSAPNVQGDDLRKMVGQTAQLYFRKVYKEEAVGAAQQIPQQETEIPVGEVEGDAAPAQEQAVPGGESTPKPKAAPPLPKLPTPIPSPRPTAPAQPAQSLDQGLEYTPSERDESEFAEYQCGTSPTPDVVDQPLITCDESGYYKYLMGPALIKGSQVTSAAAGVPQNSVSWVVTLKFDSEGTSAFDKVTAHLSTQTQPQNQFGIVLDGKVISAPKVENAITGGSAEISGSFNQKSATSLANVLKYGALPLAFENSSEETVSAKLGGDQLSAGLLAGAIGLGLVILYAILYYHGLALLVILSLIIAAAFSYAMVVLLGEGMGFALNLPGIAGAILAIGVTVDSFIIYFERIRDESREGRSLRTAIETGWVRSRTTILVADSVSLLSAVVLFILAVGSVKGFAFTLGLTTLIDIAIVFFFTKPMMTVLGRTKFFGEGRKFSGFEADHLGAKRQLKTSEKGA